MNPEDLLKLLYVAADAQTDEQKARVAWRASDYMWWEAPWMKDIKFCRKFNDICPEKPWVKELWSMEEKKERLAKIGFKVDGTTISASKNSE